MSNKSRWGFMGSHPWHKNKNVPRMGHPLLSENHKYR
jgi:hypothetical protein